MSGNVYYNPEQCGLDLLGTLDEPGLAYEYNTLIVVQCQQSGRLFYAMDSGCSCPTPFEDYHFNGSSDTNLSEIAPGDALISFTRDVENFPDTQDEREQILSGVAAILRQRSSVADSKVGG